MRNRHLGQQAIEFILVSSIVLIGSIMGFLYFGEKIASFFTSDSAIAKTHGNRVNLISSSTNFYENNSRSAVDTGTTSVPVNTAENTPAENTIVDNTVDTQTANIRTINGVPVTFGADGSASFSVNGQLINLNSNTLNNLNTVFQTIGPSGLDTEVMKAIQKLINNHQSEYPGQPVPLNMVFGTGTRQELSGTGDSASTLNMTGSAALNIVSVYVGGEYITIQKDQTISGSTSVPDTNNRQVVDTNKVSDTLFKGKYDKNYVTCKPSGKFPDQCYYSSTGYNQANAQYGYSWNFQFNESTNQNL